MNWNQKLYTGTISSIRKNSIIRKINAGQYPSNVMLLMIPNHPDHPLEIIPAKHLKHVSVQENCRTIVGIAQDKEEAVYLLEMIVRDIYAEQHDVDIRAFFDSQ